MNTTTTIESRFASFFRLDDAAWLRHANPMSVWTRYSVLPLIVAAFWLRAWIGWWCLLPGAASIAWMYLNPHVFSTAPSTKNWASRAVLGERIFLQRNALELPPHHRLPLHSIQHILSTAGMALAIWATVTYSLWGAACGTGLAYLAKSWFLDRMVWLYEDMKDTNPEFRSWDY